MPKLRLHTILARYSRFREGDKVTLAVPGFLLGYDASMGDTGTIVVVDGNIHPDPLKRMVWVRWDKTGRTEGVYKSNLIKQEGVIEI